MIVTNRRTVSDITFDIINYTVIILILIITLYPLIYVLSASFSDPMAILDGNLWLFPVRFNLESYKAVLSNPDIGSGYINSILYTLLGTAINLIMTIMCAYPLSRSDFRGRNVLTVFFSITMFFSGGMIPTYLIYRQMGLYNNIWVMILPGAVSVWNMILMRTYFQNSIPKEMQEAASIDGCSITGTLTRIILPLSKPILAVLVMYYGVNHWNAFFDALIYLNDKWRFPLQLIMRQILIQQDLSGMSAMEGGVTVSQMLLSEGIKYAVIVVSSVPMLVMYPFLQKYFAKGVIVGAVKG